MRMDELHGHAVAQLNAGRTGAAIAALRGVLAAAPEMAEPWAHLAVALARADRPAEAAQAMARALRLMPGQALWRAQRGALLLRAGRASAAQAACRSAALLDPGLTWAWNDLGNAQQALGHADDAVRCYGCAILLDPAQPSFHRNRMDALRLLPATTPEDLRRAAHAVAPRATPVTARPGTAIADRRLRVGYVGGDALRRHTHATSFLPRMAAHDRDAVELVVYSDVPGHLADDVTARYRHVADLWRDLAGLDDAAAAARIRADGIDILADICAFGTAPRLGVFASRAAPVQARLDVIGTSGVPAMDYLVVDPVLVPPGAEQGFDEKIVRLRHGYFFNPLIARGPGARPGGRLTFGVLNTPAKASAPAVAAWGRILAARPDARLIIKARAFAEAAPRAEWLARLRAAGAAAGQIELRPWSDDHLSHLATYDEIDLALDSFPYSGATTTCEALWAGVPVVTRLGPTIVGRLAATILTAAGQRDLITSDDEAYVARVLDLAADRDALAARGRGIAASIGRSALADAAGAARRLERAYRAMWRNWCDGAPPANIDLTGTG
jgi:predicted O-linked N-acetylglucosamine transferase (SPINDLY family)